MIGRLARLVIPAGIRYPVAGALRVIARELDEYPVEVIRTIHGEDGPFRFEPRKAAAHLRWRS